MFFLPYTEVDALINLYGNIIAICCSSYLSEFVDTLCGNGGIWIVNNDITQTIYVVV